MDSSLALGNFHLLSPNSNLRTLILKPDADLYTPLDRWMRWIGGEMEDSKERPG
jgi:hypothetical protein